MRTMIVVNVLLLMTTCKDVKFLIFFSEKSRYDVESSLEVEMVPSGTLQFSTSVELRPGNVTI